MFDLVLIVTGRFAQMNIFIARIANDILYIREEKKSSQGRYPSALKRFSQIEVVYQLSSSISWIFFQAFLIR